MSSNSTHESGVEGLRGFAALAVLYTHFLWEKDIDPHYGLPEGWKLLECSQGAVLLFFILSGYVIGLTNPRPFSLGNFRDYALRRIVRLVPTCWIALGLSALVRTTPVSTLIYNLLFLQNNIAYGHWLFPVMQANGNVWTLNYEALYYLLFGLLWLRPKLWPYWAGTAVALSILTWRLPGNWGPLVACYTFGWVFWIIGYGLARLRKPQPAAAAAAEAVRIPWVSILIFWLVVWQQKPLWNLCHRFVLLPRDHEWAWANYSFFDYIPACVVLFLAASGLRPAGTRFLCWLAALIPTSYSLWVILRGRESLTAPSHYLIFCAIGWALWWWRPAGVAAWSRLSWIGAISYGLYILHRPVQWVIVDATWLPSGSPAAFTLRLALVLAGTFALAWLIESWLQPKIRRRLLPKARSS